MTQQPLTWLVKAPSGGPSFNDLLTLACRGNDKIATLLYDLLFEGACVANRQNLKLDQIEFVRLNLSLDRIFKGLDERLHRKASKQSIINWRKKLQDWGFIQVDGYRHRYDIYFHKIEEAMKSPPPKEVTPRGRYAHKKIQDSSVDLPDSTVESTPPNSSISNSTLEDGRFNRGDSEDSTVERRDSTLDLQREIQLLRSEISNLESQKSKVEFEMSKVESLISHEQACRAALEAKVETLYNLIYNLMKEREKEPEHNEQPTDNSLSLSSDKSFQETETPGEIHIANPPGEEKRDDGYTNRCGDGSSPPPSSAARPQNDLLARLTEAQSAFWLRFCGISGTDYNSLNQTAYGHIVEWSDEVATQEDVQSLYDKADARIRSYVASSGGTYAPPRLGNLKNALPDWRAGRAQKQRDRDRQGQGRFVPSYGSVHNSTDDRLSRRKRGEVDEPLNYDFAIARGSQRTRTRSTAAQGNISPGDFSMTFQRVGVPV